MPYPYSMSYCRWSNDDFRCDLYCYEDVAGGWTTHVAARRYVGSSERPHEEWRLLLGNDEEQAEFWRQHAALHEWLEKAQLVPPGLGHDGKTFHDYSLEDFLARLLMLQGAGYFFPPSVIDDVRQEIKEKSARQLAGAHI
jgi:hypothetical protein